MEVSLIRICRNLRRNGMNNRVQVTKVDWGHQAAGMQLDEAPGGS
jgi:hypothetical protein